MPAQSHDDTDNLVGFDVQRLIPSDYNGPDLLSPQPQLGWSSLSCPISSQSPTSSRIAASTSSQNGGGFSIAETPASGPWTENSAHNPWNDRLLPDPQWTVAGIDHNSTQTENFQSGSSTHPDRNGRPQSRCQHSLRPSTASTIFVEEGATLRPAPRGNEMYQSSQERCQGSPHAHYQHPNSPQSTNSHTERPTSFGHASSFHSPQDRTENYTSSRSPYRSTGGFGPASPLSPLQGTNTHCSHCSCITHPASPRASPKLTSPANLVSGPTRSAPRTSSSRNLEILSECSQTLRSLVHAPGSKNLVDKRQSGSSETADEGHDGNMERRNGVEKVIVVYVNGKFDGSGD